MSTREVQPWPTDPWVDNVTGNTRYNPDGSISFSGIPNQARKQIEAKWYRNRYKQDMKPVRQQPSQEYKDQGFRTETELAEAEVREWLEMSIGVSNWSVSS